MNTNNQSGEHDQRPAPSDRAETRLVTNDHDEARSVDTQTNIPTTSDPLAVSRSHYSSVEEVTQSSEPLEDAVERDEARMDADERGETRLTAPDLEATRSAAPVRGQTSSEEPVEVRAEVEHWLDVEQAAEVLRERGISRTIRTIQKMCKRGDITARLVPADNGVRYIIDSKSIDDFVERHNQKLPAGGLEADASDLREIVPAASERGEELVNSQLNNPSSGEVSNAMAGHLREIIDLKDQQITMMQSQIDTANAQMAVKDEQIATMHERDHETNILIQNLQRLLGLPEPRSETKKPHSNHSNSNTRTNEAINVSQQSDAEAL